MTVNRRKLLCLAGCSAGAALLGGAGCGNPTGSPPTGPVGGGNLSALAVGSLIVMSNIAVARDADGVYAMSAVCTHAGCLLNDPSQAIAAGLGCPCHGSIFDGDGNVTRGPARESLQHYQVTIAADGSITVDGSRPVSASMRAPVG
jgi:Rieske Fe-S protein